MGQPKALLPYRGKTFLEHILDAISHSSVQEHVVVLGHHRREIQERLTLPYVVFNPDYEKGMTTSFQAGIKMLSPNSKGAVLFLVDHPIVTPTVIDGLISQADVNRIVLPVFSGRRGHPVLFGAGILAEILDLPPSRGANEVVHRDSSRIVEFEADEPGILIDIDTPEDLKDLK